MTENCFGEYGSRTECFMKGKNGCQVRKTCQRKYARTIGVLKDAWIKIQILRDQQRITRKTWIESGKKIRQLGQEIKKQLEKYNQLITQH